VGTARPEDLLEAAREGLMQVERALRNARRRRQPSLDRIRRCLASRERLRSSISRLETICQARPAVQVAKPQRRA
jgi:hypothetical protein